MTPLWLSGLAHQVSSRWALEIVQAASCAPQGGSSPCWEKLTRNHQAQLLGTLTATSQEGLKHDPKPTEIQASPEADPAHICLWLGLQGWVAGQDWSKPGINGWLGHKNLTCSWPRPEATVLGQHEDPCIPQWSSVRLVLPVSNFPWVARGAGMGFRALNQGTDQSAASLQLGERFPSSPDRSFPPSSQVSLAAAVGLNF